SPEQEDKTLWQRQRLELIATAAQMQTFPNGLQELQKSIQQLRAQNTDRNLLAYAVYQNMLIGYNIQLQTAEPDERANIQAAWLKSLEEFVKDYPKAPESADALLQLASTQEFNGNLTQARTWYTQLVSDYAGTPSAKRGQGALRRLSLT